MNARVVSPLSYYLTYDNGTESQPSLTMLNIKTEQIYFILLKYPSLYTLEYRRAIVCIMLNVAFFCIRDTFICVSSSYCISMSIVSMNTLSNKTGCNKHGHSRHLAWVKPHNRQQTMVLRQWIFVLTTQSYWRIFSIEMCTEGKLFMNANGNISVAVRARAIGNVISSVSLYDKELLIVT